MVGPNSSGQCSGGPLCSDHQQAVRNTVQIFPEPVRLEKICCPSVGLHAPAMEPSFGVVIGSFLPEIHLNVFAQYCFGECRIRTRGGCAASKRQINFAIASQANRSSNEKSETSCLANWVRKKKFFQGNVISPEKGINWLRRELSKSKPAKKQKKYLLKF